MRTLVALFALIAVGCSCDESAPARDGDASADAATDAARDATPGEDGGGPAGCFDVARECPAEHPHPGGLCEGDLVCPYVDDLDMQWTYSCVDGAWDAEVRCAGGCPIPPLAELCLDPFAGTLDGATVELGPASLADPFRAFAAGESIVPIVGPQGGVMLPFRLRVSGVDDPDCLGVTVTLTAGGVEAPPAGQRVTMHCGESLGVYAVVSGDTCAQGVLAARIEVDVAGVGAAAADVSYESPGCANGGEGCGDGTCTPRESRAACPADCDGPADLSAVTATLGAEEVVFDWTSDRCVDLDVPDVVVKAVRRDDEVVLLSGNAPDNYASFGPDLDHLTRDCTPVLSSVDSWEPESFTNQEWISSVWTDDGETLHALVHNEYHDPVADNCLPGVTDPSNPCWYNGITAAVSSDGGHSYVRPQAPSHLLAPPPDVWRPDSVGRGAPPPFGYMGPSNVVQGPDGGYYSVIFALTDYEDASVRGTCVMRTTDPADPGAWRLWDGDGYDIVPTDPYDLAAPPCAFVGEAELDGLNGSLTWNTWFDRFLLVGVSAATVDGAVVCGLWYSTSPDLVRWEPRRLLREGSLPWDPCFHGFGIDLYPSIVDPQDTTRTFERSGQRPFLYFTRMNEWGLDRDLLRVPLTFDVP